MTVKRSHLIGSSSARKAVLRSAYRDEVLTWSAQYGRYSEFKEVVDSALQHNLLEKNPRHNSNWDLSKAIIFALKSPNADKKIRYLTSHGASIDQAMVTAFADDLLHEVPDIVRAGARPNNGMIYAIGRGIERGELNIMKQLVGLGANNFNAVLKRAAYKGDVVAVKYMLEQGATNIEEVLKSVSDGIKRLEDYPKRQQLAEGIEERIQIQKILTEALNNTP